MTSVTRPDRRGGRRYPLGFEPRAYLDRVEPEEMPPLDEGDSPLGDEPANVADADTEVLGDSLDRHEHGERVVDSGASEGVWVRHGHRR